MIKNIDQGIQSNSFSILKNNQSFHCTNLMIELLQKIFSYLEVREIALSLTLNKKCYNWFQKNEKMNSLIIEGSCIDRILTKKTREILFQNTASLRFFHCVFQSFWNIKKNDYRYSPFPPIIEQNELLEKILLHFKNLYHNGYSVSSFPCTVGNNHFIIESNNNCIYLFALKEHEIIPCDMLEIKNIIPFSLDCYNGDHFKVESKNGLLHLMCVKNDKIKQFGHMRLFKNYNSSS